MAEYTIITDSSCDLTDEMAQKLEVKVVPLSLTMEGKHYYNTTDERGIAHKELYARLRAGAVAKTSASNAEDFLAAMEPELAAGRDILYIGFSSALSATCEVGANVARELMQKYPGRSILVIDSLVRVFGRGVVCVPVGAQKARGHAAGGALPLRRGAQAARVSLVYGGGSAVFAPRRARFGGGGGDRLDFEHQAGSARRQRGAAVPVSKGARAQGVPGAPSPNRSQPRSSTDPTRRSLSAMATARTTRAWSPR